VAILDYMVSKRTSYAGGPETPPEIKPDNQCTAISSKTKKQCTQRTNDPSGKCFAHRPKESVHTPS
jgi:hypothetical protein